MPSFTGVNHFALSVTDLDHVGRAVAIRDELVAWEERLRSKRASFTPIQDMALGHHLDFRDPDGIASNSRHPTRCAPRPWLTW